MNQTINQFYDKVGVDDYAANYRLDHGPRIQTLLDKYGLVESFKGKLVADVGGGLGFLGELLDKSTEYVVIDGAEIDEAQKLCKGKWFVQDLDHDHFGSYRDTILGGEFDAAFCLEVLEHLGSPYHCLVEVKKIVKENGEIFISIPTEQVTHNTVYPSLLWPRGNFEIFLAQMALPVVDFWIYNPISRGWPAYQYKCLNRPWREKRLLFPKSENKFLECTPMEATNL